MLKPMLVMLTLTAAVPAFADQPTATPRASTRFGALRPQSDPYKRLFALQTDVQKALQKPANDKPAFAAAPRVVCGMAIVPADRAIDPKMVVPRPSNGIDYKIRAIDPPLCNPAR